MRVWWCFICQTKPPNVGIKWFKWNFIPLTYTEMRSLESWDSKNSTGFCQMISIWLTLPLIFFHYARWQSHLSWLCHLLCMPPWQGFYLWGDQSFYKVCQLHVSGFKFWIQIFAIFFIFLSVPKRSERTEVSTRRKCPSRTCSGNASNVSFEISFKEVNDSQSAAWGTLDAALNKYYLIIVLKLP